LTAQTFFHRNTNGSARAHAHSERVRGEISWDYDRAELIADAIVHAAGLLLGIVGAAAATFFALRKSLSEATPLLIYIAGLLTMLATSAAYNVWPVSRIKWFLRRFDHSAIFLLIAATYTPFIAQMNRTVVSAGLGIAVWTTAALGILLKIALPGRFDRVSVLLYLLLGWSGMVVYESFTAGIPRGSLYLLGMGGILYSVGIVFHAWGRLRFQNVIWHSFVLLAAICHYAAVVSAVSAK
jgi:hemolysin III